MKKPLYKRELSHSYLVMENIPEELSGHYQYRMILKNRIPGLLASSERYLEGKTCLYYDISSSQSLEQLYLSARIGMKEIRGIIDNLAQVLDAMSEYLLEERFLILEPEYIYMDLETEQLFFLYYPFGEEKKTGYLPLAEFFLEHVDHREERAVSAAYQFYKMSKAENFMVSSFRTILEKGIQEDKREGAETGYSYAGTTIRPAFATCFQEEPGPYEYSILSKKEEQTEGKGNGEAFETSEEKQERTEGKRQEKGGKKHRKAVAGLLSSAILFFLLCVTIWYIKPAGTDKLLLFALLAIDGICLLVCLWKATAQPIRGEEKEEDQEEEEEEKQDLSFWEEYTPPEGEELEGPTVYLSRGGTMGGDPYGGKRPKLVGLTEDGKRQEYSLERLPVLVGKLKSRAQILLPDASVSRIHARFVEKDGKTALIDLNSTNGTFINDIRLEQEEVVLLENGDELRFGNMRMRYEE